MTESQSLHIQSWLSVNGLTWAVCEYHAILSMHKSLEEAEARMADIKRSREDRERQWAEETGQ